MKSMLMIFCTILISQTMAKDYIVVGVSGFGTNKTNQSQPSGAHDFLPIFAYGKVSNHYKLLHYSSNKELRNVISEFNCSNKKQYSNLGLIVMANSWGSGKAISLTKMYKKTCGRQADLFVMIDGVKKPYLAQGKKPYATRCINYFQTKGIIRGKSIKGCENNDITSNACDSKDSGINCHIKVEWAGASYGRDRIRNFIRNN